MSELKPCEVGQIKFDTHGNREGTIVGSSHWPKLVADSGLNEKWLALTLTPVQALDKADWSLLDSTQDSLREHMQSLRDKDDELAAAKARIAELESAMAVAAPMLRRFGNGLVPTFAEKLQAKSWSDHVAALLNKEAS